MIKRLVLIAFFLAALAGRLAAGETGLFVFQGNIVLPDDVYLAIISAPQGSQASEATARMARDKCLDFLRRSGYELARVETAVEDGRILVEIDEGQLEKIVFSGTSSLRTLKAMFALSLPYDIFNRPYLRRQIVRSRREYGIDVQKWRLVKSPHPKKTRRSRKPPDKDSQGPLGIGGMIARSLIPPRAPYELHIFFRRRSWSTGLWFDASLTGPDGFQLGLKYQDEHLLFKPDRWALEGSVGMMLREKLVDQEIYLALQEATARATWFSPPLVGELRPALVLRDDLESRQRPDLNLESYRANRVFAGLSLNYDFLIASKVSLAFGAERYDIFDLEEIDPPPVPLADPGSDIRPCLEGAVKFTFNPNQIRTDRRHELTLEGRPRLRGEDFGISTYRFRSVIPIGWHDIWIKSRGAYTWGEVPFFREQSVGGTHVRGVFGSRYFTHRVASVGLEFRYSLLRDVYKAGIFADTAVFGEFSDDRESDYLAAAVGFGPSFHILIADAFQLDLYFAYGVDSNGSNEYGYGASLNKAF